MLTNDSFLDVIRDSFEAYLERNSSRSNAKLKHLHGGIADDLRERFLMDPLSQALSVYAQDLDNGTEHSIEGRYYPKKVDITVSDKDGRAIAGYAVKFIMRNYSQNGNNYFENMLGETANIRSNRIPYFQIFIIFEKVPYFEKNGKLKKYEQITTHNLEKYLIL